MHVEVINYSYIQNIQMSESEVNVVILIQGTYGYLHSLWTCICLYVID